METQNLLKRKYTPINGEFYDKLEAAATLNQRCEMVYVDEEGNEHNIISRIEDLYTEHGEEYAVLEDVTIRLDQIKSLNGDQLILEDRGKNYHQDFAHKVYSAGNEALIGQNDFYSLTINKGLNILELKAHKTWESMDDIPDLKSQLIKVGDLMHEKFGLLNDLTALEPNEEGVLEAPFIPARGILMNAGLEKVADLIPPNCNTIVHNRGSFSVNSVKVRNFMDRYFAENWLAKDKF